MTFRKTKHASSFLANLTSTQLGLRLHRQIPVFFSFYFKQEICSHRLLYIFSLWRPLLTFIFQRPLIPVWAHILNNEIFNNKMQLHMNFILFFYILVSSLTSINAQPSLLKYQANTRESGIDVGQRITIGCGKFIKKNKHRALNKRRAWTKCANLCYKSTPYLQILEKIPKFYKCRAFNMVVGLGKKSKINKRRAYIYSWL